MPETTEAKAITDVWTEGGRRVPLSEYPCDHCGAEGCAHMAISEQGIWAFCSYECWQEGMRIDGEKVTPEMAEAAGLHYVGPRPHA
jgi:hypothetical protein